MEKVEVGGSGKAVRFLASDGFRLSGLLFGKGKTAKTCMIYLHGMGGSMINGISLAFAKNAGSECAFFSFSNRGHDLVSSLWRFSGGKRKRLIAGLAFEKFEDSMQDIGGAMDALQKLGFRRFILCGHSTGCQKAIYYQYKKSDKRVVGIALLAPADDYNLNKKDYGRNYSAMLSKCKEMIRKGKGNEVVDRKLGFSAQRLDSILDQRRAEARIFDYNGKLSEFASVKTPILAVFGSEEEHKLMPVKRYLEILDVRSSSIRFRSCEMPGADHSFFSREEELAAYVNKWAAGI